MRKNSQQTKQDLLDAAELLFAEQGIDNVTMLDIGRKANQKNRNAPNYHFGTKENILQAVLDRHSHTINEHRKEHLDLLEKKRTASSKDLVKALVIPIVAVINSDSGVSYIKINAQMMAHKKYSALRWSRIQELSESLRLAKLIQNKLKHKKPSERRSLMLVIDGMLFQGLASYLSNVKLNSNTIQDEYIDVLVDAIDAVMARAIRQGS